MYISHTLRDTAHTLNVGNHLRKQIGILRTAYSRQIKK